MFGRAVKQMINAALPLLMLFTANIGATVGVHIEELGEISLRRALVAVEAFERAIEKRTGRPIRLDDPTWGCEGSDRCIGEIRARTGGEDLVLVRVLAGPSKIHLLLARFGPKEAPGPRVAEAHLSPDKDAGWDPALDAAARSLFPEPALSAIAAELPSPETRAPLPPARSQLTLRSTLPWAAIGAGLIAGGVGAAFALSNRNARAQIRSSALPASEYEALSDRARAHGLWADVLLGTSALGLIAGVTLLVID